MHETMVASKSADRQKSRPAFHATIGREGETATFLKRSLVNSELRVIGFAPRQLNRCAASYFPFAECLINLYL